MQQETRDLTLDQALDLGCQMASIGNHQSAIGLFKGVLIHQSAHFEAIERLGASLFELGRYHEALYWFWRGRKLDRRHPLALTNYGLAVSQLGHPEEGLPDLERAAQNAEKQKAPAGVRALVYNNLGNTLERLNRHADALIALDKGISADPLDPFPHYNRGIALLRLNRHREAITALDTSLGLRGPINNSASRLNEADALYNRGMGRLLLGEFKGGFSDYEARLLTSENEVINLGLPADKKWTGADSLEGKTILLHCEQGIGDDIQFLRFVPMLKARNPTTILVIAHAATAPLVAHLGGVQVMPTGADLTGKYDCWVALMSLPMCLGIKSEAEIPPPFWFPIEAERGETWRAALGLSRVTLNVGVCWAGNWRHKNDRHRSIPLETFAALFDAPDCNFVSLQQIRPDETDLFAGLKETHTNLHAFYFDDLRDTAAAMLNLDLVISVDTAVAHLSATLGVPTKILVPAFGTDWRWMLKRSDSPWYPTATLYRQAKVGDWSSVIARLRSDLQDQVRGRTT